MAPSPPLPPARQTPPEALLCLNRCIIRPYSEDDAADMAKAGNNPKIAKWMTNRFPHPYGIDDAQKWLSIVMAQSPLLAFAICLPEEDVVIGGIGLKPQEDVNYRTMEIGYWVSEDHWRKGIATEAVVAFSRWAFETFKHVIRLEAGVFQGNEASARVLEKAGYILESRKKSAIEKNGVVLDLLVYCMLRGD